jgi:HD-GYP domain-containing protein (c-di-GMP phosphodiesterase class II)
VLRFALISGLVVLVLTASLSSLAMAAIRAAVVDQEARRVVDQAQQLLSYSFTSDDFERGLDPTSQIALDTLSTDPKQANVLRLLLWNRDGTLLYSTDRTGVGTRVPISDGLRLAFAGSTAVLPLSPERLRPFSAETMYLSIEGYLELLLFQEQRIWIRPQADPRPTQASIAKVTGAKATGTGVARLFVPVQLKESSAPAGAFEVLYDFRPLQHKLVRIQQTVWTAIPGGFLALYCAMLVMVQRTSRVMMRQREDLRMANLGTFRALASAVDAKDSDTSKHSGRVASYAVAIAGRLGLEADAIAELKIAAELHDIGKIGIPDAVLMKPGPLASEEWALIRHHPIVGSSILQSTPLSETIKKAVRHVHERWDGHGYPDQLTGEQIPLFARILAVADAFEAMTTDRPYRQALSPTRALAELQRMRDAQFDPQIVDALCAVAQDTDLLQNS